MEFYETENGMHAKKNGKPYKAWVGENENGEQVLVLNRTKSLPAGAVLVDYNFAGEISVNDEILFD